MFANSLLESAPHPAHRAAWSKLASVLLQSLALTVVLAVPLYHVERLQYVPPPPSVQMTSVAQPPSLHEQPASAALSTAPALPTQIVELNWNHRNTASRDDPQSIGASTAPSLPCEANCVTNPGPITNIFASGPAMITLARPHTGSKPPVVSDVQLGDLVHKVIPEYPIIAKQTHTHGAVVLLATIGKDGRVERVQPISGPAMLVRPAVIAVEQWRYRPYLLNHEPVVVQTQITVNFVLGQN